MEHNEFGGAKCGGNKTNLSHPSALKKSIRAGYLTSVDAKKSGGNTKKGVKTAKSSDYLISDAKKAFHHLRHAFIQALILQHFALKRYIQIETDMLGYTIG